MIRERLFFLFESEYCKLLPVLLLEMILLKKGGEEVRGERSFASSEEIGEDLRRHMLLLEKGRKQKETSPTVELPSKEVGKTSGEEFS